MENLINKTKKVRNNIKDEWLQNDKILNVKDV